MASEGKATMIGHGVNGSQSGSANESDSPYSAANLRLLHGRWIRAGNDSQSKDKLQLSDLISESQSLQELARAMVKSIRDKRMADDAWERIWNETLAVTPIEVALEMARTLASRFNQQAEWSDIPNRIDVSLYNKVSGNKVLAITHYNNKQRHLGGFELLYKVNTDKSITTRPIVPLSSIYF